MLLRRALLAVVMLPAIVAGVIPYLMLVLPPWPAFRSPWFWICAALGLAIFWFCFVSFLRHGHGTLAPWDPPQRLVVEGLYRHNRNPMYVGVLLILFGWAGVLGSVWHYLYACSLWLVFHLRVIWYEEPELATRFPDDWSVYQKHVPRWALRFTAFRG